MQNKRLILTVLTIMLGNSAWLISDNLNLTAMQTNAASCRTVGKIISINQGTVQRKPFRGGWQKANINQNLCYGDLLITKSNPGTKVKVKVKCTITNLRNWSVPANQISGVAKGCVLNPGSQISLY